MASGEHMSRADSAWFRMDRPTNLMVINAVLWFDEPLAYDKVEALLQERLVDRYPRFSQRISRSLIPGRGLVWADSPDFRVRDHLHHCALPSPGGREGLQQFASTSVGRPLDPWRPLWDAWLLDGYGDGSALFVRMHHCIADGIALARVLLSLTDVVPEGEPLLAELPADEPDRLSALVATVRDVSTAALGAVRHPSRLVEGVRQDARAAGTLARMLVRTPDRSPLKRPLSTDKVVAWSDPIRLDPVKAAAHTRQVTLNDLVVSAVTGALGRELERQSSPVAELRAFVPYNLRPLDRPLPRHLGNRFGLVALRLPVGTWDPDARLAIVKARMDAIKHSAEGPLSYGVLQVIGYTPLGLERRLVDLFSSQASLVITDVPGPRCPVYLAGREVQGVVAFAPVSGSVGASVSVFSYRGELVIGLMADRHLVGDPQRVIGDSRRELDDYLAVTRAA